MTPHFKPATGNRKWLLAIATVLGFITWVCSAQQEIALPGMETVKTAPQHEQRAALVFSKIVTTSVAAAPVATNSTPQPTIEFAAEPGYARLVFPSDPAKGWRIFESTNLLTLTPGPYITNNFPTQSVKVWTPVTAKTDSHFYRVEVSP